MSYAKKYFSINDIVYIEYIDKTNLIYRFFNNFNNSYENFKIFNKPDEINLRIKIGKFKPHIKNKYNSGDGKFYFDDNYIFVTKETYKGAKWTFEIKNLNNEYTIVNINSNMIGRYFITSNVIDFMIHKKLLEKKYSIIHASAINKDKIGCIFSSRGGGGKTTLALEMISNGFRFLGDNFTIIHEDNIYGYLSPLNIFTYNLLPIIVDNLNFKYRKIISLKKIVYKLTKGYAKLFTKINPKRIINNIAYRSKLHFIFILTPYTVNSDVKVSIDEINYNECIEKILKNQMLESPLFNRYIAEYAYYFPKKNFSQYWNKYKKLLMKNISNKIQCYEIRYRVSKKDKILKRVQKIINNNI